MGSVELRTARLLLRRPARGDIAAILRIHRDPRACAHNPGDALADRAGADERFRSWDTHWARHGFGYWTIRRAATADSTPGAEAGPGSGAQAGPGSSAQAGLGSSAQPGPGSGAQAGPGSGAQAGPGSGEQAGPGSDAEVGREPVGFCGIKWMELRGQAVLNLFYRLDPAAWGEGIAVEAARAVVGWAATQLPGRPLVARVRPDNGASLKVAERLGLQRAPQLDTVGEDGLDWIFAANWPAHLEPSHQSGPPQPGDAVDN